MAQIIDSQGREHEALIAESTQIVSDPITGLNRKIIAGDIVPADLESVYEAPKKSAPKKSAPKKAAAKKS